MPSLNRRPFFRFASEVYVFEKFPSGCFGMVVGKGDSRMWGRVLVPDIPDVPFCYLPRGNYSLMLDLVVPNDYPGDYGPCVWLQFRGGREAGKRLEIHFEDFKPWESVCVRFTRDSNRTLFEGRIPVSTTDESEPFKITYSK